MSMNVTNQEDFSIFLELFNHHFGMIYWWIQLLVRINPLPIEVDSSQITSCISINDAIWIQHWNDFENKVVTENPGSQTWPNKIVNNTFDHEWGASFTRMDSGRYHYAFSLFNLFCIIWPLWWERSDNKHVNIVTSQCLTQDFPPKP